MKRLILNAKCALKMTARLKLQSQGETLRAMPSRICKLETLSKISQEDVRTKPKNDIDIGYATIEP